MIVSLAPALHTTMPTKRGGHAVVACGTGVQGELRQFNVKLMKVAISADGGGDLGMTIMPSGVIARKLLQNQVTIKVGRAIIWCALPIDVIEMTWLSGH